MKVIEVKKGMSSKNIKLCQELRLNVCKVKDFDINKMKKLESTLVKGSEKPSPFIELIITSLLTLCDNLHLTECIASHSEHKGLDWYEVTGGDSITLRKMKKFLLDVYHDENTASRITGSELGYTLAGITFKDEKDGRKYHVMLAHPYTLTREDKDSIITGVYDGLLNILPNTTINRTMIGEILLKNLQVILEQDEKIKNE